MCIAKAEPYAEKARRREAEISGLKEALQVPAAQRVALAASLKGPLTVPLGVLKGVPYVYLSI